MLVQPTRSENFGHTIYEALSAGRSVIIGNATPWRHLREANAGWDLPPDDVEAFASALQSCIDADSQTMERMSTGAAALAQDKMDSTGEATRALLWSAVRSQGPAPRSLTAM